jgi:hypothetical protein
MEARCGVSNCDCERSQRCGGRSRPQNGCKSLQSRRNHQGTELEGCNGYGVLMTEGKDNPFARICASSDITIMHDGKLTKMFFPTENQRQRKPLPTPCHQSLIITLPHLARLFRNMIQTTVILSVLQEMRHPSINISRLIRRGTLLPYIIHAFLPFSAQAINTAELTLPPLAGMSLPLPKPLHGSIRPSLKVLRRADHKGTCVDGSAGRCAGRVGALVSPVDPDGRKRERGTGDWRRESHCSIGTSIKASSNYQSPRHHLLLSRAVHRRGFRTRGRRLFGSHLGALGRDTPEWAAREGYHS